MHMRSMQDSEPSSRMCVGSLISSSKLLEIIKLLRVRPLLFPVSFSQKSGDRALKSPVIMVIVGFSLFMDS